MEYFLQVAQAINHLSRLAVLENAPKTQKGLTSLSKVIKYRMSEQDTLVVAEREIKMAKESVMLSILTRNMQIQFEYIEGADLKSVLIPHGMICIYLSNYIDQILGEGTSTEIRIRSLELGDKVQIRIDISGNYNVGNVYRKMLQCETDEKYESIAYRNQKWIDCFGEGSIRVEETEQLSILLECV